MTRILSELLGTPEHAFRRSVEKLERISGHPNADIRLTAEVVRGAKVKLKQLGLDPHDTTGPELYAALAMRLKQDDARLVKALQQASQSDDLVAAVAHALRTVPIPRSCFSLKNMVAKQLLRKQPPKKTMKQLGYRSLDSMLKHEPIVNIFAVAWLLEAEGWRKNLTERYKSLKASDFESRHIIISNPSSARWADLTQKIVSNKKHTILALRELGAIILLPLPEDHPPAATLTTLILALQAMNEIRASSTYLKLCQVKPDFGSVVQTVIHGEPEFSSEVLDEPIHWQLIQRYYARFRDAFRTEVFEPHIQPEDLSWHSIELVLQHLEPELAFWRGTQHLSLLHERQPVSLNIADVALNVCNQLPFHLRIVHHARLSLWHELLLKYLKHHAIEQTVLSQLEAELVTEPVTA